MSFIQELKRRNVFRVGIAYVVLAWLVMQVADVILNNIAAPAWVFHVILLLLGIGFLLAIFFAWAFELTPEGLKREREVDRSQSITAQTGRRLDFTIIGVLVLALSYFAYDKFVLDVSRDNALVETTSQAVSEPAAPGEKNTEPDKSIAVLPFVNMSDDAGNEFFSEGISEELLNLLAKIPELRVAARTSSFSLKGKELQMSEVGEILKVAHVLEGSVRKAGNEVRITAQLIKADDGYHLWSQTYDRTLDNIFAIQDEIAKEVVAQLKVTLLGESPKVHETDPEAYALYLQARYLSRQGTSEQLERSIELYDQVLAIDPRYAEAWADLGRAQVSQGMSGSVPFEQWKNLPLKTLNQALSIDPEFAPAHSRLGWLAMVAGDYQKAAHHMQKALEIEPGSIVTLGNASDLLTELGRHQQALELDQFITPLDPASPQTHQNMGESLYISGQYDAAVDSFNTALSLSPAYYGVRFQLGCAFLMNGEPEAALAAFQQEGLEGYRLTGISLASYTLGQEVDFESAFGSLREKWSETMPIEISMIYAWTGNADGAFEWLDKAAEIRSPYLGGIINEPIVAGIRNDPRWLPFLQRIGKSPEQLAAIEFEATIPGPSH